MFLTMVAVHFITFMAKETEIIKMVKAFQVMHEGEDPAPLVKNRKKFCQVVKCYRVYLGLIMPSMILIHLCGFRFFPKLPFPVLYDGYAEGNLYYPLMAVHFLHGNLLSFFFFVSDLLPVLFIVRSGSNFEMLSQKLRRCTDNEKPSENEAELIACIKYHRNILRETKKLQRVFRYFFMTKVCGTIVSLTGYLFVAMTNNVEEHAEAYIFCAFGLLISFFQIGSLCLIGQWLTTKSADLLDASYECAWYNQSKSFKKTLMIMRLVCQRDVKIGAIRFDFSNASLYQMLKNTYSYYNNMSQSIESVGGKQ